MSILFTMLTTIVLFVSSWLSTPIDPFETATRFASYDRTIESYDSIELFETLGDELNISMQRHLYTTEVNTYWASLYVDEDADLEFDAYMPFSFNQGFSGELLSLDWDEPLPEVTGKVIVLPTPSRSRELVEEMNDVDPYQEVIYDEEANRYLLALYEAGAAGYLIKPEDGEETGMIYPSGKTKLMGGAVDTSALEELVDGRKVTFLPYKETAPYVEFVKQGTGDEEIILFARLDGTGYGDSAILGIGGASILYGVIQQISRIETEATIRFVFLNGSGFGLEAAEDYLKRIKKDKRTPSLVLSLDVIGLGTDDRFVRTVGLSRPTVLQDDEWSELEVRPLSTTYLDAYHASGFEVVSLNDSKLAGNDVLSERDTLDRLSGEAMQQQIDWLTDWLATR